MNQHQIQHQGGPDDGRRIVGADDVSDETRRITRRIADLIRIRKDVVDRVTVCPHPGMTVGPARPFSGPVSRDEVRAAHGNITVTETCVACRGRRDVNLNGSHEEAGPWAADVTDVDRDIATAESDRRREVALDAAERASWRGDLLVVTGCALVTVQIAPYDDGEHVELRLNDAAACYTIKEIERTAASDRLDEGQRTAWRLIARRARRACAGLTRDASRRTVQAAVRS